MQTHVVFKVIVIGLLAGVCEEMLFRGPIQISMLRKVPAWAAIGFTASSSPPSTSTPTASWCRGGSAACSGGSPGGAGRSSPPSWLTGSTSSTLGLGAWQLHHGGIAISGISPLERWALGAGAGLIAVSAVLLWQDKSHAADSV